MKKILASIVVVTISLSSLSYFIWDNFSLNTTNEWSAEELRLIQSLSLAELPSLSADPSNRLANDSRALDLGYRLFFDTRLSSNSQVSCSSCHRPELMFTDGLPLALGTDIGPRHTPSLVGIAYSPWFYWDGRKDSHWAQALAPLEASHEHKSDRISIIRLLAEDTLLKASYESAFGNLPDLESLPNSASPLGTAAQQQAWQSIESSQQAAISAAFANVGKALAAYQRLILPGRTRFDRYADELADGKEMGKSEILDAIEMAGLKLFIGQGQCINCHNGPLFTNHEFHNTGVLAVAGQLPPMGRYDGIRTARQDPFNCLGEFSDAGEAECIELRFARDENDLVGAQKTPTLRNVSLTAPYMHGGQIKSLAEVMTHYNEAPTSMLNHNEAKPLELRAVELKQLEAFIETLSAPLATPAKWLSAP